MLLFISMYLKGAVLVGIVALVLSTLSFADNDSHYANLTVESLPPDPGAYGRLTLEGVDVDADGLRDDIQIYIATTYPHSEKLRRVMADMARAYQAFILAQDLDEILEAVALQDRASSCSWYIDPKTAYRRYKAFKAQFLNTQARTQAYLQADSQLSGMVFSLPNREDRKAQCTFDPDQLLN